MVEIKTWYIELVIVSAILCLCTSVFANNLINWITTTAIIITFQHTQIADRLQERQSNLDKPTVECYYKLHRLFILKETIWIIVFLLIHNYAAITGCILFTLYPLYRKIYRKHKPLK